MGKRRITEIAAIGLVAASLGGASLGKAAAAACLEKHPSPSYAAGVERALRAGADVWGNALVAVRDGPTYDGVRRHLPPLLFARGSRGWLTTSGVYYLPFAQPEGVQGAGSVALHVADGSQILSERVDGRSLTVAVGADGRERYGSCLARLTPAHLRDGYLPVLETQYVDAAGVRYRQESFAARIPQTRSLVSFVRLSVDARRASVLRFTPSVRGLTADGNRLALGDSTYLFFSPGASFDGSSLAYRVRGMRTVYVAWLVHPFPSADVTLDRATYEAARQSLAEYWQRRLSEGAMFVVPEQRVLDAERGLLVQNLELTWRYSIGNPYEEFSWPESIDGAEVIGAYGFADVAAAMLRTSLSRRPTPYPNWKMGEKLLGSALQYRLFRDRAYIDDVTPALSRYVATLGQQIRGSPRGLLGRERYSSDIADQVYGLHSQAVVWQGLRSMAGVWTQTGQRALAARCRSLAARLEVGLRRAVRDSQRRLPDGSLFVPVRLLDDETPYGSLTEARAGSYWNLVMPYALASGLFAPGSPEATGVLRYMLRHGSRLMGLVRAGVYAIYKHPVYPTSGTDEVYGVNVARFLADDDRADQLVLSLYGQLAAAMTPDTFVSGEGATVAPFAGQYYRSMYLPPNSVSNDAFLETLRLMLVHETSDAAGNPRGLELAYATPRPWLRPGRRIEVRAAPTSFGPVSFVIEAGAREAHVTLDTPSRARPRELRLRLRLPRGERITAVMLDGRPYGRFHARSETIDLSGRSGRLELTVLFRKSAA